VIFPERKHSIVPHAAEFRGHGASLYRKIIGQFLTVKRNIKIFRLVFLRLRRKVLEEKMKLDHHLSFNKVK
jgi:hypothetical protein